MITIEQKIRQENMFGCTEAAMKEMYERTTTFRYDGPSKLAVSLMSDAQEEISMGMIEEARQTLNRAKWLLIEYVDWKAGAK
jgi:hypothetical protein